MFANFHVDVAGNLDYQNFVLCVHPWRGQRAKRSKRKRRQMKERGGGAAVKLLPVNSLAML